MACPTPVIQTIYPSGPLPAQCPAGMVALGSYGSCDAWVGELRLDVLAGHLIAPYAKIVISATPTDSEITDDPASNVAPPEMMHALEYISANHIANAISISDGTGEGTYSFGTAHPVNLAIDGSPVTTLTADDQGTVSYTLDPAALGLARGQHVLTLQSMLITSTAGFVSR